MICVQRYEKNMDLAKGNTVFLEVYIKTRVIFKEINLKSLKYV